MLIPFMQYIFPAHDLNMVQVVELCIIGEKTIKIIRFTLPNHSF